MLGGSTQKIRIWKWQLALFLCVLLVLHNLICTAIFFIFKQPPEKICLTKATFPGIVTITCSHWCGSFSRDYRSQRNNFGQCISDHQPTNYRSRQILEKSRNKYLGITWLYVGLKWVNKNVLCTFCSHSSRIKNTFKIWRCEY